MDYRPLILRKMQEFSDKHPEFTVGAMLYAAMDLKYKQKEFTKGNLYEMKDDELYGLLDKALIEQNNEYI